MRSSIMLVAHGCVTLTCLLVAGCLGGWDDYRVGAGASSGGGGDPPMSGAGTAGGGDAAPGHCGGIDVFADDFTKDDPATPLWEMDGQVAIVDGEAVLKPAAASMNYSWNSMITRHYFDLRGGALSIEIKSMVNPATGAVAIFRAVRDDDNDVSIVQNNGTLKFGKTTSGQSIEIGSTPYDASAHRFWRMREASGTMYWETSSDGMSWTMRGSSSSLFDLSSVRIQLVAAVGEGESEPGEAHFDNLNGGGPPLGKWCKPSVFKDDFDDGAIGQGWARASFDNVCEHSEAGELVLTLPAGKNGGCYYRSSTAFDLTGATLTVKVPSTPDPMTSGEAVVEAVVDGEIDRSLQFYLNEGHLFFRHIVDKDTTVINDVPYVHGEHLFWRLREDRGTLYWETSGDGQTWQEGAKAMSPFPVTGLDIGLYLGRWGAEDLPAEVHFDQLNIP